LIILTEENSGAVSSYKTATTA